MSSEKFKANSIKQVQKSDTGNAKSCGRSAQRPLKGKTVEILYQKLGGRWFAFSLIDEEVFVGSVTQEEVEYVRIRTAVPKGKTLFKRISN